MRIHIVDPSAYTPPYDDALCRALGRAGAAVELYTTRYTYEPLAPPEGYVRREHFYRLAHGRAATPADPAATPAGGPGWSRPLGLRAVKLAEHVPDMLRYRRLAGRADVVHFQWLPVQPLDVHLLPRRRSAGSRSGGTRPRLVLTAHDILPREPLPGQRGAQVRLYERFDAVVVHSEHGRRRLIDGLGVDPGRVHVIPHGAMPLPAGPGDSRPELPPPFGDAAGPVVLFFGLLRPYKGLDVLLEAWRELEAGGPNGAADAPGVAVSRPPKTAPQLWIAGMPRMEMGGLRACAPRSVRFLERFVDQSEIAAMLGRASLVVLPYRQIDASGAAFTALGAGVPLLLSDAGSFPDLAATGAARCTPAGDPRALAAALAELLGDPSALEAMAAAARRAAGPGGPYDWDQIAARTLALYGSLLGEPRGQHPAPVAA